MLEAQAGCVASSRLVGVAAGRDSLRDEWQVDLSDCKRAAPVRGAAGLPALLVGQSLPSPLVGLKCFSCGSP